MRKVILSVPIIFCLFLICGKVNQALATDICWDGGGSTNNWSEDANWAGNTEPGGSDVAVFDNGTCSGTPNKNATVDTTITVGGINMVSYSGTISLGSQSLLTSAFTQASGTIDLDTGNFLVLGDFTRTSGTFTADASLVAFALCNGCTFSGSTTFFNLGLATTGGQNISDIASGTTFTVTGTLSLDGSSDANDALDGPGGISAQGDINIIGEGIREGGTVVITINGTGTQTLDGEGDNNTKIPNVTIDKSSGTLNITDTVYVLGDWIYEQGTINAGSSTVIFGVSNSSIDGSQTLTNVTFETVAGSNNRSVTTGTTLTVTGDLTIDGSYDSNDSLSGPGEVHVQGDISIIGEGVIDGDLNIVATGTGTQTLDGEVDNDTKMPSFEIDKSNGTLNITDNIVIIRSWTYSQGTVNAGSSHIYFLVGGGAITGSHTLNDVTFLTRYGGNTKTVASGTTLTVAGDLVIDGTDDNNDTLDGPGTVAVQGDLTVVSDGIQGSLPISFTGSNAQAITTTGTTLSEGTWTINKSSGTVTLASALSLDATGQDLVISSGILDMSTYALTIDDVFTLNGGLIQGSGNLTQSNGNMTIGTTGWWVNNSTGDIDAEGGDTITNNGYVRWDGTTAGCGGTDGIALTRNGSGAVNLAGSGRWRVYDITIGTTGIYAASPALTIYSSSITGSQTGITNNGTCPAEVTWDGGGGDTNYNTGANWTGDTAPTTSDVAVLDATSTKNMIINADPNDNGFQINLGYSGTMTQSNGIDITLDDQGWEQNAGTFTGGDNTSDITINSGGDFTLNNGTFTTPAGIITAKDDWTKTGGTFTATSGEVLMNASDDNDATITGSISFYDLRIYTACTGSARYFDIASGTTVTVVGTLTAGNNTGACQEFNINGPGGISAQGDIDLIGSGIGNNFTDGMGGGSGVITINGSGTQTITGNDSTEPGINSLVINKLTGTLNFVDTVSINNDFTYTAGTINFGSDIVIIGAQVDGETTVTGSMNFYGLMFNGDCQYNNPNITVASGTTLTATDDLVFRRYSGLCNNLTVEGPGSVVVQGDLLTIEEGAIGDIPIAMTGTNAQMINLTVSDNLPDGPLTINKSSQTVTLATDVDLEGSGEDLTIIDGTLANSSYALTVNDAFTINDTFIQGTGNVSAASYTIGASANWTNTSTGDVTVGAGGVSNSGTITLGDINTCGGSNNIAVTSSSGGSQRAWSGSGTFNIYDTTIQDQGGSAAITAYSSQSVSGNGGNWTFDNVCPSIEVQGVRLQGGNIRFRGGTKVL